MRYARYIITAVSFMLRFQSRVLGAISVAMLITGFMLFAPGTLPGASAHIANVPLRNLVRSDGTLNLSTGFSGNVDLTGWQAKLDSRLGPMFSQNIQGKSVNQAEFNIHGLAPFGATFNRPQSAGWSALANDGLSSDQYGGVYALAVSGNDLYVGGGFTQTVDGAVTNLNNIAKYSGGVWSALPHNGLNGYWVRALAVSGNDLYVGGNFTQTKVLGAELSDSD